LDFQATISAIMSLMGLISLIRALTWPAPAGNRSKSPSCQAWGAFIRVYSWFISAPAAKSSFNLGFAWPFKDVDVFDQFVEGLIIAGLSGDPNDYYKVVEKNKLSENEIRETLFGRTQTGSFPSGEWWVKFDENGKCEYKVTWTEAGVKNEWKDSGQSWIEGDYHCFKFENHNEGHINCDEYNKNPDGNAETKSEYLGITYLELYTFSVEN